MAKNDAYFLEQKFRSYLNDPSRPKLKRPNQKAGYIVSIVKNVLEKINCEILINDIEKAINSKSSKDRVFEGLDAIYDFLKKLVWINNNFPSNRTIKDFLETHQLNSCSLNAWPSVIPVYKEFLKKEIKQGNIKPKTSPRYAVTDWNNAIKTLEEIEIEILSQKGTDSLMSHFTDCENFLSIVLRDSYFFSSSLAKKQFTDIAKDIQGGQKVLCARHSKKDEKQRGGRFYYKSEIRENQEKSIPFEVDKDGNTAVRDLIKDKTGYTISAGYDSIFLYYVISHIWGDAFDPRNFTNFWNLVLVPGWANFILDKQGAEDKFAKQMINTFKAICIAHYKMRAMDWKLIDKDFKNLKPDEDYIVHGDYEINVIYQRRKGQDYGKIQTKSIKI